MTINLYTEISVMHLCRGVARGRAGGPEPPGNLADQLLYSNQGGQIMPLTLLSAPPPPDSKSYLHLCYVFPPLDRKGKKGETNLKSYK